MYVCIYTYTQYTYIYIFYIYLYNEFYPLQIVISWIDNGYILWNLSMEYWLTASGNQAWLAGQKSLMYRCFSSQKLPLIGDFPATFDYQRALKRISPVVKRDDFQHKPRFLGWDWEHGMLQSCGWNPTRGPFIADLPVKIR